MKRIFFVIFIIFPIYTALAIDIGGALTLDFYNNPIVDSAPSPIQQRPNIFYNLDISIFNLKSGFSILEAYYEVSSDNIPVFNDYYKGFYTAEFDIFAYPGVKFSLTENISLSVSVGGGVRLPVIVKLVDLEDSESKEAFSWFYTGNRYLFWGGQLSTTIKLPKSDTIDLYIDLHYKNFAFREDQWIIGTTVGLLWHL